MFKIAEILPVTEGDVTTPTWYAYPARKENPKIKIDWTRVDATSDVLIKVYGRLSNNDAWVEILSVADTDFHATDIGDSLIYDLTLCSQYYVDVQASVHKTSTTAVYITGMNVSQNKRVYDHVFDLDTTLTGVPVIMFSESWLGIPNFDVIGGVTTPGPDGDYNLWQVPAAKAVGGWSDLDPVTYPPTPYADHFPAVCVAGTRSIASNLRPLEGIYSSSGADAESRTRMTKALNILRDGSTVNGRVDVWMCNALGYSDAISGDSSDTKKAAFENMLTIADESGRENCVTCMVGIQYIYGGGTVEGTDLAEAFRQELTAVVNRLKVRKSAYRVNGRLLVVVGADGDSYTSIGGADAVNGVLNQVRKATGEDFYVLTTLKNTDAFNFADAISPWVDIQNYQTQTGSNHVKAREWAKDKHQPFFDVVGNYPGRVVFGNVLPGFDDWTKQWGDGVDRQIPRDVDTIEGQFTGLETLRSAGDVVAGIMLATFDDWNEGTVWEPTVSEGVTILEKMTTEIADYKSETIVPADTTAWSSTWDAANLVRLCP